MLCILKKTFSESVGCASGLCEAHVRELVSVAHSQNTFSESVGCANGLCEAHVMEPVSVAHSQKRFLKVLRRRSVVGVVGEFLVDEFGVVGEFGLRICLCDLIDSRVR